jgi:Protein of unknown function (DUF3025)
VTRPLPPARAWDPAFAARYPAFEPLRASVSALRSTAFPSIADLQRLVESVSSRLMVGDARRPLRVVVEGSARREAYETRIFRTGELPVRAGDLHDLFNVLVWTCFPQAKAALNARHVSELDAELPGRRGRVRDALTQFDEDGMIVLSSAPELLELMRAFRWKDLFWARRGEVGRHVRFVVFGHALYEKLLAPFVGVTAKALLLDAEPELIAAPARDELPVVDRRLAQRLADPLRLCSPADLAPVPVLGIPGWFAANCCESFYDDKAYFRPGRRASRPRLP